MTAIILAGGKSTRMGKDKALTFLRGRYLLEIVVERVYFTFDKVLIATPSPEKYRFIKKGAKVKIVKDIFPEKGPLGGIYTGLIHSKDEYNFICGCDMPFLNKKLIEKMAEMACGFDVVTPEVEGFFEPLHSIYSKRCIEPVLRNLRRGKLKIKSFFPQVRFKYIPEKIIRKYDPELFSFFNLNTPTVFEKANRLSFSSL